MTFLDFQLSRNHSLVPGASSFGSFSLPLAMGSSDLAVAMGWGRGSVRARPAATPFAELGNGVEESTNVIFEVE